MVELRQHQTLGAVSAAIAKCQLPEVGHCSRVVVPPAASQERQKLARSAIGLSAAAHLFPFIAAVPYPASSR